MDEQFDDEIQDEPVAVELDLARLTSCARLALDRATEEARRFGDPYVGTDHVLLALASLETAAAKQVLDALEMTTERLNGLIRFIRGGEQTMANGECEYAFSPRLQRVLAAAAKDSAKRSHAEIGTLHLLSGLLREKEGLAVFLLESPGVGLERAGGAIAHAHREGLKDE
jgi:ATP-dependent Clp protease ATP-binding subunit ClpC